MFRSCAFCNASFDGDGGPSGLGVGRRLAFDEWRGRLWVVCSRCSRWNLTPFDDRLERIERVARAAAQGRVSASTEQVSLIRRGNYDFVRVGKPRRVELATWRYGERLRTRQRERMKVVVPLTVAAVGLGVAANVAAGGGFGVVIWNLHNIADWMYVRLVGRRRVTLAEPPVCAHCGTVMALRARHVQHARVVPDRHADVAVVLSCPRCHREGAQLTGVDAVQVLRQGLTYLNVSRGGRKRAEDAARVVDAVGGPNRLVREVARGEPLLVSLRPERRLALEMAVDEQVEATELERQWREAEEIAEIADGLLSGTPALDEALRRLKTQSHQPPG
ncbi:MAG: HNH endonuclease signature motif containing protein [Gemmatimonadales bacterium]